MTTLSRPSLARNAVARFSADASALVFGSIATIVTARALGPSGQGVFASLFLLCAIGVRLCSVGLGETAIVRVGQGAVTRQDGLSATLAGVLVAAGLGVLPFFGVATLLIGPGDSNTWLALLAGTVLLPVGAVYDALSQTLNGQERLLATSRTLIAIAGLTLAGSRALRGRAGPRRLRRNPLRPVRDRGRHRWRWHSCSCAPVCR